jgi:hypothetical protein
VRKGEGGVPVPGRRRRAEGREEGRACATRRLGDSWRSGDEKKREKWLFPQDCA